ncbi:S-adenosyl-L-methionine-dependent methyltransferase [Emericellopsis atlantica]|uniref:S-adenosyl-L-methionine-dependent methyltransferase n=1 Tax=Emericellopsis atlantica TaxID=2614577 RepID=A0A9P7ZUJ1_9HYPO|nr:S-adenosyl-L-methionine-dependent methyltransferase [Emericellopsis atlantica]KAG9258505.1 S-adenosyl-L-methionine-dependent methyltransferase [Emericellopsis atlantica]
MSDERYLLNRDAKESARLIAQHDWLQTLTGCDIHPCIKLEGPNLRIADVATGTGIWLLDLAKKLPETTQFYGFDISEEQFPATDKRPGNVSLHKQNVLQDFPEEYHGSFDLVAVRLITAGLRPENWSTAVENVTKLLKPGGYLQWIEPLHGNFRLYNLKPGAPNAAARTAVGHFLTGYNNAIPPGPETLPQLCDKHQLEDLALEVYPTDHYHDHEKVKTQSKDFLRGACTAMMPLMVGDESEGRTKEQIEEAFERAAHELDGDIYIHSEMQFIVRRKRT